MSFSRRTSGGRLSKVSFMNGNISVWLWSSVAFVSDEKLLRRLDLGIMRY
jgi:hypothetical protein